MMLSLRTNNSVQELSPDSSTLVAVGGGAAVGMADNGNPSTSFFSVIALVINVEHTIIAPTITRKTIVIKGEYSGASSCFLGASHELFPAVIKI